MCLWFPWERSRKRQKRNTHTHTRPVRVRTREAWRANADACAGWELGSPGVCAGWEPRTPGGEVTARSLCAEHPGRGGSAAGSPGRERGGGLSESPRQAARWPESPASHQPRVAAALPTHPHQAPEAASGEEGAGASRWQRPGTSEGRALLHTGMGSEAVHTKP